MSPSSDSADVLERDQVLALLGARAAVSSSSSVMPITPFIGVRISWLMLARNSLFARLAASAASRACAQLLGGALLLGDVARHRVDEPLLRERRRLPREPAVGAVLAAVAVLEAAPCSAPSASCRASAVVALAVVGVHELDVRPRHQLLGGVAERLLPRGVEAPEVAVDAGDAQHVERQLEERRQLLLGALALRELADLARRSWPASRGAPRRARAISRLKNSRTPRTSLAEHGSGSRRRRAGPPARRPARGGSSRRGRRPGPRPAGRLCPDAAGQADRPGRSATRGSPCSNSGKDSPGAVHVSTQRRTPSAASTLPQRPVVPAERLADRLQDRAARPRASDDDSARARATAYCACSRRTASFSGKGVFMWVEPLC